MLLYTAGGLGTYLHADYVRTLLPKTIHQYHAMADAGYKAIYMIIL